MTADSRRPPALIVNHFGLQYYWMVGGANQSSSISFLIEPTEMAGLPANGHVTASRGYLTKDRDES